MNKMLVALVALIIAAVFASCSNPAMPLNAADTETETIVEKDGTETEAPRETETSSKEEPAEEKAPEETTGTNESGNEIGESGEQRTESGNENGEIGDEADNSDDPAANDDDENAVEEDPDDDDAADRPTWARGKKWDGIDWSSFDWQEMSLQEILDYLGINGNHYGWDK